MQFDDQNPSFNNTIVSEPDPTYDMAHSEDSSISKFFARPIQIESYQWSVGAGLNHFFNPWSLWASNPRVVNRLNNYRNFRGKLCLKVMINGNQFYWGRAMLSYSPTLVRDFLYTPQSEIGNVMASQRPHILLDPSTSQGGSMCLPFFWPTNAVNMTSVGFTDMGECWLAQLNPLRHAIGTDPVRITIFAWMEDVHLSGPTQIPVSGLTPQSGVIDEYIDTLPDGPVSRPANIVAMGATVGAIAAPEFAPYALAAAGAASTVSQIAKLFGYSRPAVITTPTYTRPKGIGNLVNTNQPDTCTRLTFDAKQEVTTDPRTVGLGPTDELAFEYIAKRETYVATAGWIPADNPGKVLCQIGVTPFLYRYGSPSGLSLSSAYIQTPLAWMGNPFRYWQGTMRYRFQIVASGYHKGRLKFVWDPVANSAIPEDNVTYSHIVDIAEARDFSIDIGWGNDMPALACPDFKPVDNPYILFDNSFLPDNENHNGTLSVYVLNDLVQSGVGTQPIEINVYASSHDMSFHSPDESRINTMSFLEDTGIAPAKAPMTAQSGIVESDENTGGEVSNPVEAPVLGTMGVTTSFPKISTIISGEVNTSFRTLMKRYCRHSMFGVKPSDPAFPYHNLIHTQGAMPYNRGYSFAGVDQGFNDCQMTMINYVMPAYLGWRGGLRWKIVPRLECNACVSYRELRRCGANCDYSDQFNFFDTPGQSNAAAFSTAMRRELALDDGSGFDGMDISVAGINGALEVEIPYYSNTRFQPFLANLTASASAGLGWKFRTFFRRIDDAKFTSVVLYDTFVSTGEDFNAFYFNGVPPMWQTDGPP